MNIHRFKRLVMGAALLAGIVGSSAVFTAAGGDDNSNSNSNSNNDGERFSVALWGDMPYVKGGAEWTSARQVENLIADVNKQKVAFSVFDGDIKSGSSFCDNSHTPRRSPASTRSRRLPCTYRATTNGRTAIARTTPPQRPATMRWSG